MWRPLAYGATDETTIIQGLSRVMHILRKSSWVDMGTNNKECICHIPHAIRRRPENLITNAVEEIEVVDDKNSLRATCQTT